MSTSTNPRHTVSISNPDAFPIDATVLHLVSAGTEPRAKAEYVNGAASGRQQTDDLGGLRWTVEVYEPASRTAAPIRITIASPTAPMMPEWGSPVALVGPVLMRPYVDANKRLAWAVKAAGIKPASAPPARPAL